MIRSFLLNTKTEILKCRNTAALWLTLLGAGFVPLINIIKCLARPDYFIPKLQSDPWGVYLDFNWQIAAGFLLIMYVILLTSLVVQIEFRNNAWKQVFASPRSYVDIFFSKMVTLHLLMVCCFILFNIFILLSAFIINLFQNQYNFSFQAIPINLMFTLALKMYVSILSVTIVQYCLSLHFSNFMVPIGIGLGLFTAGFMIRQWEYIYLYPYMHPMLIYFPNPGLQASAAQKSMVSAMGWSAAGILSGIMLTVSRFEKG